MEKLLYILLIVSTLVGCQTRSHLEIEFERHLPKTDFILLQRLVDAYDNFIEASYSGDTDKFFSQIELDKPIFIETDKQSYCEILKMFDESTLDYKSQKVKYDSVYLSEEGNIITIRQKEDVYDEELKQEEEITILSPGQTIEEEIEKIKEEGYWRLISESSFKSALLKISKKNPNTDLEEYIKTKETIGYVNPQLMASSIIKN